MNRVNTAAIRPFTQRGYRLALTAAIVLTAVLATLGLAQRADAITPTIVNSATGANGPNWLDTQAFAGEGGTGGVVRMTFIVRHDPGRKVTGLRIDGDYNGNDDSASVAVTNVTAQQPNVDALGGFSYSRVTYTWTATQPGFSCPVFGTRTRRKSGLPLRVRARLDNGTETSTVAGNLAAVANGQCLLSDDYPFLYDQADVVSATPGQSVNFTFKGDDADIGPAGGNFIDGMRYRWRRLNDGAVSGLTTVNFPVDDNALQTLNVTAPTQRGHYVYEAELAQDSMDFNNAGYWFYVGSLDVNAAQSSTAPGGTLTVPGRPNINSSINATLSGLTDASGDSDGRVQMIEWDLNGDGTYESRELSDPEGTAFTTAQLTRSINTTGMSPGTKTVKARLTDNGSMNGADNTRRQTIVTDTFTVDTPPVVNDQAVSTDAGTGVGVTLGATDANSDTLTYSIQSPSADGVITGGTTASPTFTPNAGFAGTTSFTVKVDDGFGGTDTAVITVNVRPNTQVDSGPTSPTNVATQAFTFSSPEAGSGGITFECSVDSTTVYNACSSGDSFTFTGDGSHVFRARAKKGALVDATPAAYSFVLDQTPPPTTVASQPPPFDSSTTAGFSFTSTESPLRSPKGFDCNLDGAGYTPCDGISFFGGLSQGSHTLLVRAVDAAGNIDPSPKSVTWFVDSMAPDTGITGTTPMGITNSNSATFTFIGQDTPGGSGVASFQCTLTNTTTITDDPCASPKVYSSLPDGQQTFRVGARDQAGNLDPSPATFTWSIDTAPPTGAAITSGPGSFTNDPTPTFQVGYTGVEPNIGLECSIDGGTYAPCGANYTPTVSVEGSHTLSARAYDPAGNRETTPATYGWTYDVTPPTVIPVAPLPDPQNTTRFVTSKWTASEPVQSYSCTLNGVPLPSFICGSPATSSPLTFALMPDGPYVLQVSAVDLAGNPSTSPYSFAWAVDGTPPTGTVITSTPPNDSSSSSATFGFENTTTADLASFECDVDGGGYSPCTSPNLYPGLSDGSHTFKVRAVDNFGNREATPQSYTWNIDTDNPDTSFDTQPPAFTNAATAPFDLASDESPVTYECKLPGSSTFASCNEVFSLVLAEGDYTVEARAVDAAGNKDDTPAVATFTVDRTDPETTIDNGPTGFVSSTTATFDFSSGEPGTFECRLDSTSPSDWAACTTGSSYPGLSQGSHTFDIRAIDRAGNKDQSPASRTWTVDTVNPSATIVDKPASLSNTRDPRFTFTSDEDPNVTYTCTLDGTDAPCTTPKDYTGLADGSHTFKVKATDRAGNPSPQDSYTWDLDATPPTGTTIDSGPTGTVAVPTAVLTFSNPEPGVTLQCKLDGGAFTTCVGAQTLASLAEGSHTYQVRAKDPAGNLEVTPASRTWTVDLSGPDTTLTDGPTGTVGTGAASFGFNASEAGVSYQCSLDGGQWEPCTSKKDYPDLGNGGHSFRVRARDAVGNVDPTPAERAWTVAKPAAPQQIVPEPKAPDPCTFRGLAAGCEDTRAGAKLIVAGKGGSSTASTAGSPELASAALTLRSGAKIKVSTALGGKQVGTFSLADRKGTTVKTGKLTLPKKPTGTVTLFSAAGLKIALAGQTVTLTGLPRNVYRVAITLNGKTTGILVPSTPCSALSWRAVLTDRLGAKQTVDAKGTCPPTTGAKR